jgi:hypothetical protein
MGMAVLGQAKADSPALQERGDIPPHDCGGMLVAAASTKDERLGTYFRKDTTV